MSKTQQITIYYTSDIHGYLFPTDYVDKQDKRMGLLKCVPNFKKDENTLIIDGGDMLQGSAMATFCQKNRELGFPQAQVLNYAGYDFVTIGNHDVNFGTDYLYEYLDALKAKCICENIFQKQTNKQLFPSVIKTLKNGLKIGIVGIVTDYINIWEKKENIQDITITDPFEAAKQALKEIKPLVDTTVCVYHGGFERDVKTGKQLTKTTENIGYKICEELEFDLLLTGHQHLLIEGNYINNTYVVQPSFSGLNYFKITIEKPLDTNKLIIESIIGKPGDSPENEITKKLLPIENKVQKWLDKPIGLLSKEMLTTDKKTMAIEGSSVIELIGAVQLAASQAQITCVSLANTSPGFHKKVTMRDIIATYPYTNQLITLQITGEQLKKILEKNSEYFSLDSNGYVIISPKYLYPKLEHYNYDYFIGISYVLDIRQPIGRRVTSLTYQEKEITNKDTFTLSLSNYRANGGGNFPIYTECSVLDEGSEEIVAMIVAFIQSKEMISIPRQLDYTILPK